MMGEREVMSQFIELYKSEPCLWMISSKEYHNRALKAAAYDRLVAKLREIDPHADRDKVVKKINNLRTNYRKEMKKVIASEKSGARSEDVYAPTLWYFEMFHFLWDQEKCRPSISNTSDSENEEQEGIRNDLGEQIQVEAEWPEPVSPMNSVVYSQANFSATHQVPPGPTSHRPGKRSKSDFTSEVLTTVKEHFKCPTERIEPQKADRFDIFGQNVAMKLRDLEKTQRILVEKIINDALFEAEMGALKRSHQIIDTELSVAQNPTTTMLSNCSVNYVPAGKHSPAE